MLSVSSENSPENEGKTIPEERSSTSTGMFKTPSYKLILPVIFLYFLLVFGLYPLTAQVHIQQVCRDLGEDDCESSNVSAKASTLNLISSFAYSIPSILTCGIYGSVADVYGRKVVMIIPYVGFMFYALAYLYVDLYDPSSYVAIIIAGNFIMGLSGGYFTFIMSCMCYASDVTALVPHTRNLVYSITEATIFVPEVFGPVLTGLWATYYGFFVPLLLGVLISAVTVVYVCFIPESLPKDALSRRKPLKLSPLQTFTSIMFLFTYKSPPVYTPVDSLHTPLLHVASEGVHDTDQEVPVESVESVYIQSPLPILCVSFFMYLMASLNQASVRIVYVIHRFGWNSSVIGVYDGMEGLVVSVSMLCAPYIVQRVQHVFKIEKRWKLITWIQIGYVFRILHWGLFGLMDTTTGIFCLLPLLLCVGPLSPYIRTIVSNSVPASEQANVFAAYSALEGISSLAGPVYSAAYTLLVRDGCPWVIFELMAAAVMIALCIVTYVRCVPHLNKQLPEEHSGADTEVKEKVRHSVKHTNVYIDAEDPLLQSLETESEGHSVGEVSSTDSVLDTTILRHLTHSREG